MARKVLIIAMFLFSIVSFAQKKKEMQYVYSQKISNEYTLVFSKYNKAENLYSEPKIIYKGKANLIADFNLENYTSKKINVSKNKKFVVMDNIIKGYVQTENDSVLHENYTCVIVDLKKMKVVFEMQSDCGGSWSCKNQWVNDGKVLF